MLRNRFIQPMAMIDDAIPKICEFYMSSVRPLIMKSGIDSLGRLAVLKPAYLKPNNISRHSSVLGFSGTEVLLTC